MSITILSNYKTTYDTKSRKGDYIVTTFKTDNERTRSSIIKIKEGITLESARYHAEELSKKPIGSIKSKTIELKKNIQSYEKKQRIEKAEIKKRKLSFQERKKISENKLFRDRKPVLKPSEYEINETRIIMKLKDKNNNIFSLSEDQFKKKLTSYMGEPRSRERRYFLEDIVNKWGLMRA